ncbi:MAG: transporter substrate-binding domain-containing protein [Actinomycetota bacterium]
MASLASTALVLAALGLGALALAAAAPVGPAAAQTDDGDGSEIDGRTIVVATKPLVPFVIVDDPAPDGSGLRGYSVDLWNELGTRLGIETEWLVEESVTDILESARDGDAEVAIAGISMTAERESFVDFTHPYFDSGLRVATVPGTGPGTLSTVWDLLTNRTVLVSVGGLVLLSVAVAHMVWLSERRHNEQFPQGYREGVGEALWWSTVSMVTGGEAVKDIRHPLSRLVAVAWMVLGLFLVAYVTAQAAARITVNELQTDITGVDDLAGRSVVTVDGTVAATYLREANLAFETVPDIDTALAEVADGRYDAVIYDSPILAYRVDTDYAGRIELVGGSFAPDPYGIALTSGSDLRELINAELLLMSRDGTLDDLNQKWLGVDR